MAHELEQLRQHDRAPEHFSLVDQVGEAMRMFFGAELAAGAIAFLVVELSNPAAQLAEQPVAHEMFEENVALLVQLLLLSAGHGRSLHNSELAARGSGLGARGSGLGARRLDDFPSSQLPSSPVPQLPS